MRIDRLDGVPLRAVFDFVAAHLLTQMEKAGRVDFSTFGCEYKDARGYRCAVGCLIPDALYSEELEGSNVLDLPFEVPNATMELLSALQTVHDGSEPHEWESKLRNLAAQHGFTFNLENYRGT
jgi:hypothetical protein